MFRIKSYLLFCYICVITLLAGCAKTTQLPPREPASATEVENIASAFEAITTANADAWNAYNFDAMEALYTDDIVFTEVALGDHLVGIDQVMNMVHVMSKSAPYMRRRITNHYIGLEDSLCEYDYWNIFGSTQENPYLYVFQFKTRNDLISNWTLFEGSEFAEKANLASKERLDQASSLLSSYQSAWSSGDAMKVAGLYTNDAERTDTIFRENQQGQDAISAYAEMFFTWYPGVKWNLQQSFGEWIGESPTIGGTYTITVNDSTNQPCEILAAVLLHAPEGKITNESLYYEPGSLIQCGWAK